MAMKGNSTYPALLAVLSAALFGAATPACKSLLGSMSSFQLAGVLYLGAAAGVLPVVLRRGAWRHSGRMSTRNRLYLLGAVVAGGCLGPVFLLLGLRAASAASVSMLLNFEMVATAVIGRLWFHDYLGRRGWMGVAGVVLAGALLSAGEGTAGLRTGILVALACICWGFDNHFTALIDGITPAQSTLWKGLAAGCVNLGLGLSLDPFSATVSVVGAAWLVGALSYGVSITLYITSAQGMGATRAQMFFASAPFWGAALSVAWLGEPLTPIHGAAAALLALSLFALFSDRHEHLHSHVVVAHEHSHRHDDMHHGHSHAQGGITPRHSHWHEHAPVEHSHPHWPDLHHRHTHEDGVDSGTDAQPSSMGSR